ncbi:putative Acetyl-CoA acetyltransferase; cytosolic 1 [Paratrimastix pyriformis]|uniref:acetyl-CoA C-acetyltransferase n=1 Tax=Paratrimastix pyriformis TaxID=342808 RepID=A0ABQ8U685_9EUKA|nr:putative Acetyl-CoA acetyltransferase; cytosolic 1 [Paratrimastix pyriformis]|eukprot:GAFH01001791.1.p1 GENE.GAFH01001791.1~~GAFH01001791.1.p1  ORF type:complete len:394 (+),score=93.52 GAFH01001791.1:20-1201(+)
MSDRDVCIIGYTRTPMGCMSGCLASLSAVELGTRCVKGLLEKVNISATEVQTLYMGAVLEGGMGQNPAKQVAFHSGLPPSCTCTTVNKVCASSMKAMMMAAQDIALGMADVVVAGGMESMTQAVHFLRGARSGFRLGHVQMQDSLITDGLWDAMLDSHMGNIAEGYAEKFAITRQEQDDYALQSYSRARAAYEGHLFDPELLPVTIKERSGEVCVRLDEQCHKLDMAKFRNLRPAFSKTGTITPGNASPIADGAAAVLLVSRAAAVRLGRPVLAVVRGYADAEQEPAMFGLSSSLAVTKALERAHMAQGQVDYFEINEAFSVVALANMKVLNLDAAKVNVYGGAVALGHPLGTSGARIMCTLLNVLTARGAHIGAASICNGGGGASAMVIERP